eukprot:TRINITY_DN5972_c0_g1_i1.p1 TRINITY_DN5972_c0_g1~~TRINITY_DN5972_c0_g1_i1.p1  ORF type:complete len:291 (+),score=48.64 TRINITY_DN5972_c0_g1_i1:177-1049(+)
MMSRICACGLCLAEGPATVRVPPQSVIACVKSELQQPYNLGVISREQFMKMCSTVTKDFLARAPADRAALTAACEAHLRATTTALLTKVIGTGSVAASPERDDDVRSAYSDPPTAAPAAAPSSHMELPRRAAADTPSSVVEPLDSRGQRRAFVHTAVDTPGAVLAASDTEVLKYQDHLSRLAQLNTSLAIRPSATMLTPRGGGGSPAAVPVSSPASLRRTPTGQSQSHVAALAPARAARPQEHLAAAKECQSEMLKCMGRMNELYAQMSKHLHAIETAMPAGGASPHRGY